MNTEKKTNWFTRILIILLGLLLMTMIVFNFFCAENGKIEYPLLLLISLLIIIFLSEEFDNLSFGKILTLKKNIQEKKEEITELKTEKQNLLNLLISNVNFQKQTQNNGISGSELRDIFKVIKADPEKVKEETKEKEEEIEKVTKDKTTSKRLDFRKLEKFAFNSFITGEKLSKYAVKYQIQLASNDPISSISPVFDGFVETENSDIFIEIKSYRSDISALMIRERLYQRLMNVFYFQQFKGSNAFLQLILIRLPQESDRPTRVSTEERIRRDFAPAIDKGLLKIYHIELDEKQEDKLM